MSNQQIPRPEYPRPQMRREFWLNLNGIWQFEIDPGLSGQEKGWASGKEFSKEILVPFCPESELSGIKNRDFMPSVWYRRSFKIPENWSNKHVWLHFGAVDYEATVWLNGRLVGGHRGGYTPFAFDITDFLQKGENELVLRVFDDTRSPTQPTGKQSTRFDSYGCLYTRTTGIWQTVWLEAVPEPHITSLRMIPDLDAGRMILTASLNRPFAGLKLRAVAQVDGRAVAQAETSAFAQSVLLVLEPEEVRAWSPSDPFLYDLILTLEEDGTVVDRVESYFGLRKVHIQAEKILLNNQPVFQRLVLDQGFYPDGIYTAPTDEALKHDIEIAKGLGFNGARLHQKVFEPRFLYWADRLGYLVWGEYPNWGIDHSRPELLEYILPEWLEAVDRDFNHPSIVGWCPFNETPREQDPQLIRTVYRTTKLVDPSRPVIDTSGYVHVETDVYDCHNYEQDAKKFAAFFEPFRKGESPWRNYPDHNVPWKGQPYFVSEYGGIWWNPGQKDEKSWGYGQRPRSEEEFLQRYRALTEALLFHPRMCGFCYTQLYDIEQEVNGLYTYDRKPKFDPGKIQAINSQLAVIEEKE